MPASRTGAPDQLPVLPFRSQAAWEAWLERHHTDSPGLWLKLAKLASGTPSVTYQEALETALCFGWIDGLKYPFDAKFWLQRFTPRRPRSKWSRINCDKVTRLLAAGSMRPAGIREVEAAKREGRWEAAYPSQRTITVPPDLRAALKARPRAAKAFADLTSSKRYAILYRIHDAKRPATRAARIELYVARLAAGETFS